MTSQEIRDLGISVALLVCIMWWVGKVFWPWLTKQIEEEKMERKAITQRLTDVLEIHNRESREIAEHLAVIRSSMTRRSQRSGGRGKTT